MTIESNEKRTVPVDETIAVMRELHLYKPLGPADHRTGSERFAGTYANWGMASAAVCFLPPAVLAFALDPTTVSGSTKMYALASLTASVVLAFVSMIVPILATAWTLRRWGTATLENFESDIVHEHLLALALNQHAADALKEAKMWLELKIKRVEGRISWFFGEKTAVLTLIASAYLFSKEFGGFSWVKKTLEDGPHTSNAGDTTLLFIAAALFGLSIGAVLLKRIASKYRYQVELIDLALR